MSAPSGSRRHVDVRRAVAWAATAVVAAALVAGVLPVAVGVHDTVAWPVQRLLVIATLVALTAWVPRPRG